MPACQKAAAEPVRMPACQKEKTGCEAGPIKKRSAAVQ
jgi:hypothetical protein